MDRYIRQPYFVTWQGGIGCGQQVTFRISRVAAS